MTPSPLLEPGDHCAHLHAELRVEVRQRLVVEVRARLSDEGAAHRDALTLAAGQVGGLALEVLVQLERGGDAAHAPVDLVVGDLVQAQREGDVLVHGQRRIEGVVLEHHGQIAGTRRLLVDALVAEVQVAVGDVLEPDDHAQERRLARPRRADEDHELTVGDLQADIVDGCVTVAVALADVLDRDRGHCRSCGCSALHGAAGEPGDDAALEDQDQHDDRDRHDHRRRGDRRGGLLEL